MTTATPLYKGHRYPVEIINDLGCGRTSGSRYFCEVEELMLVRGVAVSYETIRRWCARSWAGLRQPAAPAAPAPRRQVAPRRGVRRDQRQSAVSAACVRPACNVSMLSSHAEPRWRSNATSGAAPGPRTRRPSWSPTSWAATRSPTASSCRRWSTGGRGRSEIPSNFISPPDNANGR